jgi:hypothetical protein
MYISILKVLFPPVVKSISTFILTDWASKDDSVRNSLYVFMYMSPLHWLQTGSVEKIGEKLASKRYDNELAITSSFVCCIYCVYTYPYSALYYRAMQTMHTPRLDYLLPTLPPGFHNTDTFLAVYKSLYFWLYSPYLNINYSHPLYRWCLSYCRGGVIKSAKARETEGIVFYEYEFENPLDMSLPRVGAKRDPPTKGIELYELCVAKGRLWSVQATVSCCFWVCLYVQRLSISVSRVFVWLWASFLAFYLLSMRWCLFTCSSSSLSFFLPLSHLQSNDKLFPAHESTLRAAIASFIPKL